MEKINNNNNNNKKKAMIIINVKKVNKKIIK